ncbi:hypothetical protein BDZ45DRAFT_706841 [Acephala macrosclerotiorum]|nr:hypothetical protein BDZ45DRAFT_706841 [Acephala macrosclerotiorum]
MQWTTCVLALLTWNAHALPRFSCPLLVTERLDPYVLKTTTLSNASTDPANNISQIATCTTCTFSEDFSDYWTAVLYFHARNRTFKHEPRKGNATAIRQGFRMLTGDANARTLAQVTQFRQITYTCLQNANTRSGGMVTFPTKPCPAGIMSNIRFPAFWDGVNINNCLDTTKFNDKSLWPGDGPQPFVWSQGDPTGVASHGGHVMDANCNINYPTEDADHCASKQVCEKPVC